MRPPWHDLLARFSKWNSVFQRFRHWARKGVFDRIFKAVSDVFDRESVCIDGTVVKAHAKAVGCATTSNRVASR